MIARAPFDPDNYRSRDAGPLFRRARKADPETSKAAAREVTRSGAAAHQAREILAAMLLIKDGTSQEIAAVTELDRYQVARRLPELREAGRVENGPARECTISGRKALTWRIA